MLCLTFFLLTFFGSGFEYDDDHEGFAADFDDDDDDDDDSNSRTSCR